MLSIYRADTNKDNKLDPKELSRWINIKIIQHISAAVRDNFGLFMQIDISPRNGVVSWDEYHAYFLRKRGFDNKYVENHDEKRHKGLQRSIKGNLINILINIIIKVISLVEKLNMSS